MLAEVHPKVTAEHLRRDAFIYVRQSTPRQVLENTESTQRQYALRDRAVALGWPNERIHTIDEDLGIPGEHAENRDGFQYLVSEVALSHAGIVLGLEVSRLARNNADWQRLLELCALSGTLISDEDGVYDPAHFNDRLLLGLKGTMSEAEVHVLKARLLGGLLNKARRGELALSLPIGLVYGATGAVTLDPDRQIQNAVRMIFDSFREIGSANAIVRRFQKERLQFPRRTRGRSGTDEVTWAPLEHFQVLHVLHNPRYAGAFVFGRTRTTRTADLKSKNHRQVAQKDWTVLIRDAHPGYISWEEFERNQITLRENLGAYGVNRRGTLPREGSALLQGHALCGRCGTRMRTRYQKNGNQLVPYYICAEENVRRAGRVCQSIRGSEVDTAVSELLLRTVAPAAIKVALAVQEEIAGRINKADGLRRQQLERTRYEAELKRRRFFKCDPSHRLVADALEADWNDQLRRVEALQQEHERHQQADEGLLSKAARERILALARDFQSVWSDPHIEARERKRMLALLIEDVTLVRTDAIAVHVRFRGGQTTSLNVAAPKPIGLQRKFKPEFIAELDKLLDSYTEKEAAEQLNVRGHRNWKQQPITRAAVFNLRHSYKLRSRFRRLRERGMLFGEELGKRLGVSATQVHQWGRAGLLVRHHYGNRRCLYEPIPARPIRRGKGGRRARAR